VRSTYEDREGTLWVCTAASLEAFDRRTERVRERIRLNVPESISVKVVEDHAGVLWIAYLSGNGLASYERHERRLTLYSFKDREPPVASRLSGAEGIHADVDGNLWLATRGSGLVKIDPTRRSAVRYRHSPTDPDSISEDLLVSVFEDHEGSIWVGTATTGVNRFRRKPLPFSRYRHEPGNPQSLLRTSVTSVYADSQENVWVGSELGLTRIDAKSGKYGFFREPSAPNSNVISIVEDRSGYLWFGTYGGLHRYDPRTGRFAIFRHDPADSRSLSNDIVYSLIVDRQGTLWAGTGDGLNRLEDAAIGRFRSWKAEPPGASPQDVTAIVEDSAGLLWFIGGTLQRFDPVTGSFAAYQIDPVETGRAGRESSAALVQTGKRISPGSSFLAIDHTGVLWIATANGLVRFDRGREQFTTYDEGDGLPATAVHAILEDRDGKLWVSTAGGLSRFDPGTTTFTNFYDSDGLAGSTFEGYPAAAKSRRGQMFFGSKSGLTSFWPEQIVDKASIPRVVLTQLSLRNLPVAPGSGSVLVRSITSTPSLTLLHDQNHLFSFEFAALSYADPQRNQYRYMLEPLDDSWHRVDPQHRMATFTTLPAGHYTLRVQGANNRGLWNEQGVTLRLQILPPWWGTTRFRSACAGVFVALLLAGYQLRVRQLHRRFEMTLEARVGERTRIAREIHDTLLQSFQGVLLDLASVEQLLRERPIEAQQLLGSTMEHVSEAIAQGRDAVQGLRISTVESTDLALAISTLGDELAKASKASRPEFHVAVEGKVRDLHLILRDEVYKIAAEALRNTFQHALARQVEVEIRYDDKQFRLRVRDDGKGIDPAVLSGEGGEGHYGLRGMRERATLIGGSLTLWSEVDAGSEVELCIPASTAYPPGRRRSTSSREFAAKA
jgi:signal transduction histidine kinase/ligand-binding sensor domain-containing protein